MLTPDCKLCPLSSKNTKKNVLDVCKPLHFMSFFWVKGYPGDSIYQHKQYKTSSMENPS
ncbi:hypothetical protein Hanom_Chr02g00126191 [Helianthus anomalus]